MLLVFCLYGACLHLCIVGVLGGVFDSSLKKQYACVGSCSDSYALSCSSSERVAIRELNYGTKPGYTTDCPDGKTCQQHDKCCTYKPGDCLVAFSALDRYNVYDSCARSEPGRCGWFPAVSSYVFRHCQFRKESNYIMATHACISSSLFVDMCSDQSVTGKSVHLRYQNKQLINDSSSMKRCECTVATSDCGASASRLVFRAVDVRLHPVGSNITKCSRQTRIDFRDPKNQRMDLCYENSFRHGFSEMFSSFAPYAIVGTYVKAGEYPSYIWLAVELEASDPNVEVTVSCGTGAAQNPELSACVPPQLLKKPSNQSTTETTEPTLLLDDLDDEKVDTNFRDIPQDAGGSEQGAATGLAGILGGAIAGAVVLLAVTIFIIIIIVRRKKTKESKCNTYNNAPPKVELTFPLPPDVEDNYYETVNGGNVANGSTFGIKKTETNPYQNPWDNAIPASSNTETGPYHTPHCSDLPGIPVINRAKAGDLAYATSEEIQVLIEKMEQDRQCLNEGQNKPYVPDPKYYCHINDFNANNTDDSIEEKRKSVLGLLEEEDEKDIESGYYEEPKSKDNSEKENDSKNSPRQDSENGSKDKDIESGEGSGESMPLTDIVPINTEIPYAEVQDSVEVNGIQEGVTKL